MGETTGATFGEFSVGGLLDDADVTIKSFRFRNWDYNGNIASPVLGLQFEFVEDDGTVTIDVASAGDLKSFQPSPDGKKAVPMGSTKSLNGNTNAALTLISLMQADTRGELAAKLKVSDDISIADGVRVHMIRKPQPKRKNMPVITAPDMPTGGPAQAPREKQYIHIEKIIAYPWEAAPVAQAAPAQTVVAPVATQAAAPAAAAPAGGNVDIANGVLLEILSANNMQLPRTALAGKLFANPTMASLPPAQKNAILGMMVGDAYLTGPAASMGIAFDPAVGIIKLG